MGTMGNGGGHGALAVPGILLSVPVGYYPRGSTCYKSEPFRQVKYFEVGLRDRGGPAPGGWRGEGALYALPADGCRANLFKV